MLHKPIAQLDVKGKRVLVVGAGPRGLKMARDISNKGGKAYLLDSTLLYSWTAPVSVEGKTLKGTRKGFKSDDVIRLEGYKLRDISRENSSFKLTLKKRVPFVDHEKCDGCTACERVCPAVFEDEDNRLLSLRTAISQQHPEGRAYSLLKEEPPCQTACPLHLDIRGYIGLIADGKFEESVELIRKRLPFPGVIGRICTRPCEDKCNRSSMDEPLNIRGLKRFVSDWERKKTSGQKKIRTTKKDKIAVIGSGPAGLTCAHDLRLMGYQVTVFESLPVCGGMLAVGIPEFRLPKKILNEEIDQIRALGVRIENNVTLGKDLGINELFRHNHQAIFLSTGAHQSVPLNIVGEDSEGVITGVQVLRSINLGKDLNIGRKVCVVGGGNVAIDVARALIRLGAEQVTIAYRRTKEEMPTHEEEVTAAIDEGVHIEFLTMPVEIISERGKVTGLRLQRCMLGKLDASGRRRPIPIEGSEFCVDVDMVIPAIGQKPELSRLIDETGIRIDHSGTVSVHPTTLATNVEGVFSGGDVVTGPKTAIEAIASGKRGALSIHKYLSIRKDIR